MPRARVSDLLFQLNKIKDKDLPVHVVVGDGPGRKSFAMTDLVIDSCTDAILIHAGEEQW